VDSKNKPPSRPGRNLREGAETIVFVVVLVLILKEFVAEAFVIPTGSMATTLYGNQEDVRCPQCGFEFPVNCSSERDQAQTHPDPVAGCICPNCRFAIDFRASRTLPSCKSGDRVIVGKFLYDTHLQTPERQSVVVFKYPEKPNQEFETVNYIKRLIGKPGETIGIHYGDIYVYPQAGREGGPELSYRGRPLPANELDAWRPPFMYQNDPEALALFKDGKFEIVRKAPAQILAMRRIVYDNDHQAKDLIQAGGPARWAAEKDGEHPGSTENGQPPYIRKRALAQQVKSWETEGALGFRHPAGQGPLAWLRYRHLLVPRSAETRLADLPSSVIKPELITDFLGYNTWQPLYGSNTPPPPNWVGDLIVECQATLKRAEGELVLELSKGSDRFQARWEVATGQCALVRITEGKEVTLATQPTTLKGNGTFSLRFANVDQRLIVWVNSRMPFGDGVAYAAPQSLGPFENDLEPASIGVSGGDVEIRELKMWRDTYYSLRPGEADASLAPDEWSDPAKWAALRELPAKTLYVQPGHYLCLGDNSLQSFDSRGWGTVPHRLLQGRAILIYFPINSRFGLIH